MKVPRINFIKTSYNYVKTACKNGVKYMSEPPCYDEFMKKSPHTGLTTDEFIDLILKSI